MGSRCRTDEGRPAFALGPAETEADAAEIKDAVRLPAGWTVTVVELRKPYLIDTRTQPKPVGGPAR